MESPGSTVWRVLEKLAVPRALTGRCMAKGDRSTKMCHACVLADNWLIWHPNRDCCCAHWLFISGKFCWRENCEQDTTGQIMVLSMIGHSISLAGFDPPPRTGTRSMATVASNRESHLPVEHAPPPPKGLPRYQEQHDRTMVGRATPAPPSPSCTCIAGRVSHTSRWAPFLAPGERTALQQNWARGVDAQDAMLRASILQTIARYRSVRCIHSITPSQSWKWICPFAFVSLKTCSSPHTLFKKIRHIFVAPDNRHGLPVY